VIGEVPGWARPAWRAMSPEDFKSSLERVDDHVRAHLAGRPPPGLAAAGDLNRRQPVDPIYWRNFAVAGQPEELSRSEHIAAFDLERISGRERSDERVQIFPGGFVLEMTWTGLTPDGLPVRARAGMLHLLDDDLHLVRVHEYLDAAEVAPLLKHGVPGVVAKAEVPPDHRGRFQGWRPPDWRAMSAAELVAHFAALEEFVDAYVHQRPPPGGIDVAADVAAGIDYPVWRNYRPVGQPEEVARSVHLAAFDLLRYEERRRADERTFLFPGGFAYEMTWLGVSTDGATARIRSLLVYFLDEHRRIVRLHEYADAREVVAVLREGVTP
jgi:hypothetical protein